MEEKNEITSCGLCSEKASLVYKRYPGYQIPTVFDIYHCPSCNTSFSMPRIESNDIYELIYKNGPKVRWYDRYWENGIAVKTEDKPLNYLAESEDTYWAVKESLSQITSNKNSSLSILEIGCGLGYLTYSLKKAGFNSTGLDISQEAITNAVQNYGNYYVCADLHTYALNHENEYDIIIFTELIEHLNDIFLFIESMKKLLKPEGQIILTTPNKSFYPDSVIWATDLPPVHCWWLSERSIEHIAGKMNLSVSFLNFRKYYSRHATWVNLSEISIPITPSVFDYDGRLIGKTTRIFRHETGIRKVLKKIELFKIIYTQIRYLLVRYDRNILIPREKGPVLCAILKRN
jgi:SAM-dependent methyltransferase